MIVAHRVPQTDQSKFPFDSPKAGLWTVLISFISTNSCVAVAYRMKRDKDPWSPRVECYTLRPGRLGFEFGQHVWGLHGVSDGKGEAVASTMQLLASKRREEKTWRKKLVG